MAEVHRLNLARFTEADLGKVDALHPRLRLLRRWFRYERITGEAIDQINLYSGDRSHAPYIALRLTRDSEGRYTLYDHRTGEPLAEERTIDRLLERLPDRFFSS